VLRPRARDFDDDLRQLGSAEAAAWLRAQLAPEDATCLLLPQPADVGLGG
jgi:hypothetical protein